ncbi:Zinc finger, RING/FYVE/PHD-type [Cynara cardunculus var. scolymus]|uniref:Zinc finger, RING/FYVE/PHD-type n=1 Tax=Cynara cardunculus var. scolymus TaxID=59895 RepID=A0A103XSZ7_CYNCS|nr:Zinc finger, RING/FYVE/PHD-type [Cynara cardunculus var. scolymus]
MVLLFNYLKSAWSILLHHSFFNHHLHWVPHELIDVVPHRTCRLDPGSFEQVECTVCLSAIGEDEQIKELRCGHLFHQLCLDQWLGFGNMTCPLCRDCLMSARVVLDIRNELLVFDYFSTRDSQDEGLWWLR